MKAGAYGFHSV